MFHLIVPVSPALADELEAYFCEEPQQHWVLYEETRLQSHELQGFFESEAEARAAYDDLQARFPGLSRDVEAGVLEDRDWKDAYKLHFRAWQDRGLHFVPVWEREDYRLPVGDQVVWLDPGMAFGTGNHETTRLCIRRLIDARDHWAGMVGRKHVIDAGCGSGILAIAAAKLGFGRVEGFDNDPDSVRISVENAQLCDVAAVQFRWAGLEEGLAGRTADLVLANILAPVLMEHAGLLLDVVAPGGRLALSGILRAEVEEVKRRFLAVAEAKGCALRFADVREDGDWADLLLVGE